MYPVKYTQRTWMVGSWLLSHDRRPFSYTLIEGTYSYCVWGVWSYNSVDSPVAVMTDVTHLWPCYSGGWGWWTTVLTNLVYTVRLSLKQTPFGYQRKLDIPRIQETCQCRQSSKACRQTRMYGASFLRGFCVNSCPPREVTDVKIFSCSSLTSIGTKIGL